MKKFITTLMAAILCVSLTACGNTRGAVTGPEATPAPSFTPVPRPAVTPAPSPDSTENPDAPVVPHVNSGLLQQLEEVVYTAAPGTAGSSLKAVYAAKDLLSWLDTNRPDSETIALTAAEFMLTYADTEEALWAYENVANVFKSMSDRAQAGMVLEGTDLTLDDFAISAENMTAVNVIFKEMDSYRQ